MNDNNFILGPSSSPETDQITKALALAQSQYKVVEFDAKNSFYKDSSGRPMQFATYSQCCDFLRGPLNANGIALPDFRPGIVTNDGVSSWVLVGTLRHDGGQYLTGICPLYNPKADMQGFGAAMTYGKRTLLMALTGGFTGEADDDGNAIAATVATPVAQKRPAVAGWSIEKSREIEVSATAELAKADSPERVQLVVDKVRLRVSEKKCSPDVLVRIQKTASERQKKEAVHNG